MAWARRAHGLLAVLGAALLFASPACRARAPERPVVAPRGDRVEVDLAPIAPGGGRFFTYRSPSGRRADFLVYREGDGDPRAVLDACTDCYRWRKGYRLEEGGVVCAKCGMRFRLDELAEGLGACVPIALPAELAGETLRIPVSALEEGTKYF